MVVVAFMPSSTLLPVLAAAASVPVKIPHAPNGSEVEPWLMGIGVAFGIFAGVWYLWERYSERVAARKMWGEPDAKPYRPGLTVEDNPDPEQGPNLLHGVLTYPGLGGLFALGLGLVVPLVVCALITPDAWRKRVIWLFLGASICASNLLITRFSRVRITTPLIPIPLAWLGAALALYGAYEATLGWA